MNKLIIRLLGVLLICEQGAAADFYRWESPAEIFQGFALGGLVDGFEVSNLGNIVWEKSSCYADLADDPDVSTVASCLIEFKDGAVEEFEVELGKMKMVNRRKPVFSMAEVTTTLKVFNGLYDAILPGTVQPDLLEEHYFWQINLLNINTREPGPAAKLPFTRYMLFGGPRSHTTPAPYGEISTGLNSKDGLAVMACSRDFLWKRVAGDQAAYVPDQVHCYLYPK